MINCLMGDIVRSIPALSRFREEKLPIMVSLNISRISKVIDSEYEIYTEQERHLLDLYAEKDKDGNFVKVSDNVYDENKIRIDDIKSFQNDMDALFSVPLELIITPIPLSQIINITISSNDIHTLFYLFEDDVTEPSV